MVILGIFPVIFPRFWLGIRFGASFPVICPWKSIKIYQNRNIKWLKNKLESKIKKSLNLKKLLNSSCTVYILWIYWWKHQLHMYICSILPLDGACRDANLEKFFEELLGEIWEAAFVAGDIENLWHCQIQGQASKKNMKTFGCLNLETSRYQTVKIGRRSPRPWQREERNPGMPKFAVVD